MATPAILQTGDSVAIVAPAGTLTREQISFALSIIESWGLKIQLGKNLFSSFHNFSGTDKQRNDDLQEALDNPDIKAVFCARGGYGLARIIDKINWNKFIAHPKWVVGFSDVTVLHSFINNSLNIASIHGPMPVSFEKLKNDKFSLPNLKKILFGEAITYELKNCDANFSNDISGKIIGGNLSLLYALRGTPLDFNPDNKILFIEDIGEYYYHIDRIIQNLRLGNKFTGLKALILGGFSDMKDNDIPFGYSIEEMICNASGKNLPVIKGFQAGHIIPNYPIILGHEIKISRKGKSVFLEQNQ